MVYDLANVYAATGEKRFPARTQGSWEALWRHQDARVRRRRHRSCHVESQQMHEENRQGRPSLCTFEIGNSKHINVRIVKEDLNYKSRDATCPPYHWSPDLFPPPISSPDCIPLDYFVWGVFERGGWTASPTTPRRLSKQTSGTPWPT